MRVGDVGVSFALAVGSAGQPRVSRDLIGDLRLYARDILWLDQHALFPIVSAERGTE